LSYPPQQPNAADEWFDGSAVPSASFNGPPPITWAGRIVDDPVLVQKRDFDDGTPLTWPDGRPKQLLQVNIQTDVRDPNIPDDDGKRALYLEFRKKDAVQDAIKRAGQKGAPKKDGWVSLTYTSDDLAAKKGKNAPPKNFYSEYRAPDPWAGEAEQGWPQGAQPAQQAPQQSAWAGMPPPQSQPNQAPYTGPQQAYQPPPQQGPPPQQYQQQQMPPAQAPPQAAPPQQGDPLVEFLKARNIDANVMPREQAVMIATNLGYQGPQ
jgi:hypothetical protein